MNLTIAGCFGYIEGDSLMWCCHGGLRRSSYEQIDVRILWTKGMGVLYAHDA